MFHRFPKPVERRRLWLAALGIPSTTPEKKIKQYSVCEEHFKREDYKQKMHYASRKMVLALKKTAVPSVFDTEAERSASSMPVSVIFILPWVIHCQHCNCNVMLVWLTLSLPVLLQPRQAFTLCTINNHFTCKLYL